MKSTLSILFFLLLFNTGKAQTYFLGSTDPSGDNTQPLSPDAKAIYHATDMPADSLWFKMEFFRRIDNVSWNVKIGIDTNNMVTDGGTWTGLNTTMKYDLLADIYNNPGFPPPYGNILTGSGAYISSNVSISLPDTNILIVGLRLSEVQQAGTVIHYISGAGIIVGLVNDDIPDANYISIPGSTGIENYFTDNSIFIYPNPADDELHISVPNNLSGSRLRFNISDAQGKVLKAGTFNSPNHTVNISSLQAQKYFLNISNGKLNSILSFIKQ